MDINRRTKKRNKETKKKAILKLFQTRIDNYIPSLSFLTDFQITKFIKKCYDKLKHESYSITINYKNKNNPRYFPFIFLLTKKQKKNNQKALKNESKYTITFSGDHFKKICKQTLDLNVKFNLIFEQKLLTAKEIKDLKKNLASLEEDLMLHDDDDDDDMLRLAEELREDIFDIKKKLKSNKNIPIPIFNIFSDIDNTPKKNTLKRVKIDNTLSKEDFFKIYNINKISHYIPFPVYMDNVNLRKLIEFGEKLFNKQLGERDELVLNLSLNKFDKGKITILYLTKSQIKTLREVPQLKYSNQKNFFKNILFSRTQIDKTFSKVMEINGNITRDKKLKIKKSDLLRRAYKINKDLITFDDDQDPVGDLITFDDDQDPVGDLIDFKTEISNPKVIPSYGRNILRSLLVSDKVTNIFGNVLSSNLDKAISKLNTEISSGLYHIINSIINIIKINKLSINKIRYFKDLITQFIYSISNNI